MASLCLETWSQAEMEMTMPCLKVRNSKVRNSQARYKVKVRHPHLLEFFPHSHLDFFPHSHLASSRFLSTLASS
ncbi:hypothetical protein G6O67_006611 [Ophiocordyceps sinensis]|uniref:Uncharacterized protein n=1 Tax=Ophiocordyceps sinensis TaxID=72228 RepID=A0A8H4LVW5_9HYPO|nr:hypothetical protein G6O67_006611 [Ophiocordyceps sinensis]